jgi:hypothetical protein
MARYFILAIVFFMSFDGNAQDPQNTGERQVIPAVKEGRRVSQERVIALATSKDLRTKK